MTELRLKIACMLHAIADRIDPDGSELGYLAALRRLEDPPGTRFAERGSVVALKPRAQRDGRPRAS